MKKILYFFLGVFILSGCSAYKVATKKMASGNYAEAFEASVKIFQKDKSQKKKDKQLVLLQNSYLKANEEDEQALNRMKLEKKPNYKNIYYKVITLYNRVNTIKPLLPLYNDGKELKFPTKDYSSELTLAKENYLSQYYATAVNLLETKNKTNARKAYEHLAEVMGVDKYYRDAGNKQKEAYNLGADIIYVTSQNQTGVPFPTNFRDNLLYSLNSAVNDFWTIITTNSSDPHDYEINVLLRQAFVGNDIVTTNNYNYEKEIIDGWEYLKDRRGNIVKDSLGNSIKVDKYITVRAQVTEYVRHKEAMLSADVQVYNSLTGSMIKTHSIVSNFAFNASFATMTGDERALGSDIIKLVRQAPISFPDNYDMIAECGKKLRRKLINILDEFN